MIHTIRDLSHQDLLAYKISAAPSYFIPSAYSIQNGIWNLLASETAQISFPVIIQCRLHRALSQRLRMMILDRASLKLKVSALNAAITYVHAYFCYDSSADVSSLQGITRLILTRIPFFREVLLESFSCEDCGNRNTSIKPAGEIQELGSKYTLKVEKEKDLERQIIRNDTAVFKIEGLDLEMPTGHSEITNVEGMLGKIHDELELSQAARKEQNYQLYTALKVVIEKINRMRDGEAFPFTISIDDPSGNSFIEPSPSDTDGKHQRSDYKRTHQQSVALGLASNESQDLEAATTSLEDLDLIEDKQYTLQERCPSCAKACEINITKTNIPHFKECIIIATVCDHCGYRTSDIKTGGEIPEKGRRITISVETPEDLSRDILKSESCTLKSTDLELEVYPGTLGGRFTTVEGLLSQFRDQLYGQIFDASFDNEAVASGDVKGGDSMTPYFRSKWLNFFKRLEQARKAEIKYSITLEDPFANSYVQSLRDPEPDPQIAIEDYERTEDEMDELGLKDMKTEGYEKDPEESEDEGEIPAVPSAGR